MPIVDIACIFFALSPSLVRPRRVVHSILHLPVFSYDFKQKSTTKGQVSVWSLTMPSYSSATLSDSMASSASSAVVTYWTPSIFGHVCSPMTRFPSFSAILISEHQNCPGLCDTSTNLFRQFVNLPFALACADHADHLHSHRMTRNSESLSQTH